MNILQNRIIFALDMHNSLTTDLLEEDNLDGH